MTLRVLDGPATNIPARRRDATREDPPDYTSDYHQQQRHFVITSSYRHLVRRRNVFFYYTRREAVNVVTTYTVATIYISAYSDAITRGLLPR